MYDFIAYIPKPHVPKGRIFRCSERRLPVFCEGVSEDSSGTHLFFQPRYFAFTIIASLDRQHLLGNNPRRPKRLEPWTETDRFQHGACVRAGRRCRPAHLVGVPDRRGIAPIVVTSSPLSCSRVTDRPRAATRRPSSGRPVGEVDVTPSPPQRAAAPDGSRQQGDSPLQLSRKRYGVESVDALQSLDSGQGAELPR